MAQVMKFMVDFFNQNERTLRNPFPSKHDSQFKLRFTTLSFKKNTHVIAMYMNRLGKLKFPCSMGTVVNSKDHLNRFSTNLELFSCFQTFKSTELVSG